MYDYKLVVTPVVTNSKLQKNDGAPEPDASKYRSLIGSLIYLTTTQPNIMYATSLLSRLSQIHFGVGKRILRYLQETKEFSIWYTIEINSRLLGYIDMKSTSNYAFSLGSGIFS